MKLEESHCFWHEFFRTWIGNLFRKKKLMKRRRDKKTKKEQKQQAKKNWTTNEKKQKKGKRKKGRVKPSKVKKQKKEKETRKQNQPQRALIERACEYVELGDKVEVSKFVVRMHEIIFQLERN